MKIDPSTTSTNLDYGHNSEDEDGSGDHRQNKQKNDEEYRPILPHDEKDLAHSKKLAARKARKKKRKIAERRARQKKDDDQEDN